MLTADANTKLLAEVKNFSLGPIKHYKHSPLQNGTSIRVLRSVKCESGLGFGVKQIDLDDDPSYRCLSYTWGNPLDCDAEPNAQDEWKEHHQIFICEDDGPEKWEPFLVTTNLYDFLKEFSGPSLDGTPWIWIDAICINQSDLKERSTQVGLMRRIYRSCHEVLIWLGREGPETQCILELMSHACTFSKDFFRELSRGYLRDLTMEATPTPYAHIVALKFPPRDAIVLESFAAFLQRSWFHRLWTMQECILPSQGQIWYGKSRIIDLTGFSAIGLLSLIYFGQGDVKHRIATAAWYLWSFLFCQLQGPFRFLNNGYSDEPSHVDFLAFGSEFVRSKSCSIPQDYIYAMLGWQDGMIVEVDYEAPVEKVFADFTLQENLRPYLFQNAGLGCENRMSGLPTWVSDFRVVLKPGPVDTVTSRCYRAGVTPQHLIVEVTAVHGNILCVESFQEDEVALICKAGHGIWGCMTALMMLGQSHHDAVQVIRTRGNLLDEYWRTRIFDFDRELHSTPAPRKYGPLFRNFFLEELSFFYAQVIGPDMKHQFENVVVSALEVFKEFDHNSVDLLPSWQEVETLAKSRGHTSFRHNQYSLLSSSFIDGRPFIVTKKGRMGIGSEVAEVGDAIVIVEGCTTPLLMRKGSPGRWKHISEAYVHGIMNGEALEGRTFATIEVE